MLSKLINDIKTYIYGTDVFYFVAPDIDFSYPIDFTFTLKDQKFYFLPFDELGIPCTIVSNNKVFYSPSKIAAYAFAHYRITFLNNDYNSKDNFLNSANWFLSNEDALYFYEFDWINSDTPWISALAQGMACSVLLRAYKLTNDKKFLIHAEKSLKPFFILVENGGVQSRLADGSIFLEEYPLVESSHVFNGFMFALIGLSEYVDETNSKEHTTLLKSLYVTLNKNIGLWTSSGWSLYEDPFISNGKNFSTPSYHSLHITQLKWFCLKFNSNQILEVLQSWEHSKRSFFCRFFALLGKVFFRLKKI
ncbi:MAG: D-glucuronyl C5-epimerase family protein [Hellea sp.]